MESGNIILSSLMALFAGLNVFQFIFLRSTRKKYEAEGIKAEADAEETRQTTLERRLAAIEQLYAEQGRTIDSLRIDYLKLSEEKFLNEKRIVQLEGENKALKEKVDRLEREVAAYKTLSRNETDR